MRTAIFAALKKAVNTAHGACARVMGASNAGAAAASRLAVILVTRRQLHRFLWSRRSPSVVFVARWFVVRLLLVTMFRVKLRKIIPYINKQVLREKNG